MGDQQAKILIVDDESFNINVLVDQLKDDYKTIIAKNGDQALKKARAENSPDLILLDVMMPDMDGYEVCRQLKADPKTCHIPIIFVTAMGADEDEAIGLELGSQDYIIKPASAVIVRARVKTHLELASTRKELENQIVEQAKMAEVANQANRAKSDFLSSMSHELRTPMNSVIGFSQLLLSDATEPLTPAQQQCVDHISQSGRHLLELINEILDLAKVESGSIEIASEFVLPAEVFKECCDLLSRMASEKSVTLAQNIELGSGIMADRFRFRQIALNLLSNAIKYNREGGVVTCGCMEQPDGVIRMYVSDTGHGIPADLIPDIFTPFERLNSEQTEIEGTGIGLTITKRLADAMGGTMGCDSEVGVGSTFWIDFPQAEESSQPVESAPLVSVSARPQVELDSYSGTLLYIEDDKHNTALMELVITLIPGLSMISAQSAELGVELAKSEQPDLIITDIGLPGMDGYEALSLLKGSPKTAHIPVIGLSASAMPHDMAKAESAGFQKYLTKPIDIDVVTDTIRGLIHHV